jgi:dephospho-CoA kinase
MILVGLTGGIGSGKSTFARLLEARGATVIDADEVGRRALDPGQPAWHSVVDTFGVEVLSPGSMEVDRARLAEIVFAERTKLAALNAIVHPVILAEIADSLEALRGTTEIVVLDAALLIEVGLTEGLDALIVVVASDEVRRERLVRQRGMLVQDVDARMAAQASQEELVARADVVVRNERDEAALEREADRVWADLVARRGDP